MDSQVTKCLHSVPRVASFVLFIFGTLSIINARCFHLSVCRKAKGKACESLRGVSASLGGNGT